MDSTYSTQTNSSNDVTSATKDPQRTYSSGSLRERAARRSFTAKVAVAFAAISAMTVLVAAAVLSFVWEDYFQTYTRDNMQRLANSTAAQIAESYESFHGDWYTGALAAASAASALNDSVSIQVVNANGEVIYDDTSRFMFTVRPTEQNSASAPILVDHKVIGTVYVRVFGSNTLLTQADEDFKADSYGAVIFASIAAIVIAAIVGLFFARALVRPINRIADAANEIKEGNYQARANVEGSDEIARLGNISIAWLTPLSKTASWNAVSLLT